MMNVPFLITGLILTFLISLTAIPILSFWARKHGLGDVGGERHHHLGFIPVIGGIAFVSATIIGFALYSWGTGTLLNTDFSIYAFFVAMLMVHFTGIADDVWRITPGGKFLASALAATLYVFTNPVFSQLYIPLVGTINLGIFAPVFSVIWIIGIINAINLIDGIDGLAGGVSIIILIALALFAYLNGDVVSFTIILFLIASTAGFLVHNYPPADVFMGDGGSLVLGFALGTLPQRVVAYENGFINFFILISLLMLPFVDTATAFIRRMLQGKSPFRPDKEHLHHRIITLGASPVQTTWVLWLVSIFSSAIAVKMYFSSDFEIVFWFFLEAFAVIWGVNRLGYIEIRHKKFLPKWKFKETGKYDNPPIIFRKIFHRILLLAVDFMSVNFALWVYVLLKMKNEPIYSPPGDFHIPVVGDFPSLLLAIFWLILFYLNNLYDLTWDTPRVDRIISMTKVTVFGIMFLSLLVLDVSIFDFSKLINLFLYWLVLTSMLILMRFILNGVERKFRALEYAGKNTLIIGCGEDYNQLKKDSKENLDLFYNIIGCIDKKKRKEALGIINDLLRIIHEYRVEEIIFTGSVQGQEEIFDIIAATENLGIHYKISPALVQKIGGLPVESILSYPLFRLKTKNLLPWQKMIKRLMDIFISVLFLLFSFIPVFLYTCYVLLRDHEIWRKEIVIGRFGRPFYLYKWISESEPQNRIDHLFHHLYLSKFTFFIRVLFSQISVVGPQLQGWTVVKHRLREKPYYRRRFMLKPGIIGPSQIVSILKAEKLTLEAELEKDRQYLEESSLSFDINIMVNSLSLIILNLVRGRS